MTAEDRDRAALRLLGPTERQVTCEECFDLLDEYVELEAAGFDADTSIPGMRPHLQGCPACNEEHESLLALVAEGDDGP